MVNPQQKPPRQPGLTLPSPAVPVPPRLSPSPPPPPPPPALSAAEIHRLGRHRPAYFATLSAETALVATVVFSMVMAEYLVSGFNVMLPTVAHALRLAPTDTASRTWPAAAINLAAAALFLVFARLCDMCGPRAVFLAGHAWTLVWCLAAAAAPATITTSNPPNIMIKVLIVCRAMQGVGIAAFLAAGLAILAQIYRPGPRKNLVFAVWGAFACVGFYLGILVGALAAQLLTWPWFFWIAAMVHFAIVVSGFASLPPGLGSQSHQHHQHHESSTDTDTDTGTVKMDWLGAATIVPGLALVVFALTQGGHAPRGWKTPYVGGTLSAGLILLASAVYIEGWVAAQPLLPAALFRARYMKRLCAVLFCCYGAFGLFLFYMSFLLETALRASPLLTAAWFAPLAAGGLVLSLTGGLVMHIIPNRVLLVLSTLGFLLSVLLPTLIPAEQQQKTPAPAPASSQTKLYWAYIFPSMLAATLGIDVMFNVTNVFITTAAPRRLQASASGLINSLLYFGMAFWLGVAELAVSLSVSAASENNNNNNNNNGQEEGTTAADGLDLRSQYHIGFWVGIGLAALSTLLTLSIKMGSAEAAMTADEKAALEREEGRECAGVSIGWVRGEGKKMTRDKSEE